MVLKNLLKETTSDRFGFLQAFMRSLENNMYSKSLVINRRFSLAVGMTLACAS